MHIKIVREEYYETCTIGKLYIDGVYFCATLEDKDRGLTNDMSLNEIIQKKVYGQTAIPTGIYKVILSISNKFKRILPEILNVPNWSGVRIHSGNTAADSLGCILVGNRLNESFIANSRNTEKKLIDILSSAKDEIILEII